MLGRRRAGPIGTPSVTTFPQGTWAPWTATIGTTTTPGVRQDQGGPVGHERDGLQGRGEWVAAMPQPPGWVESQSTSILLGVDHEDPARADHQVDAPMVVNLR